MKFSFCLLLAGVLSPGQAGALLAAADKVDITPQLNCEKTYIAGFGATGRTPAGIHDPLYARVIVIREGNQTVALIAVDLLGLYGLDVEDLRARAGFDAPHRALFIAATHTHSGPDTLGFWGPRIASSGVDPAYQARIKSAIAATVRRLENSLSPAYATAGHGELNPQGLCRDARDPQVIDPDLNILRLRRRDGSSIATVVNWSCHPEVLGRTNRLITADYPGALCALIEKKTGGACLFFNGMIGGMMTPDVRASSYEEAVRVGETVAKAALALSVNTDGARPLAYHSRKIRVPVENSRYRLLLATLAFGHRLFDSEGRPIAQNRLKWLSVEHLIFGLSAKSAPWIETEVALLDVGPARLLGLPAEPFPELAIGGYDGRYSFARPVLTPDTMNPPMLANAPKGPYLRASVRAAAPMLIGLANDEIGYLIPEYDFKVRSSKLMLPRLPGHYEETNSIGPSATSLVINAAKKLLEENP